MSGPLEGIRVLELTSMITGPLAAMMLADQGAEVIKIESPGIGDIMRYLGSQRGGVTSLFASCNRSKQSIVVDLKEPEGLELVKALAKDADVFIQNFRNGVIDRLGLGAELLQRENPNLIYVSLNAFGESGPFVQRPAYDHILQGMIGAPYVQSTDPNEKPEFMRQTWCDKSTALTAAQAITAALFARERGAGGQHVRLSMLDASLSFLWPDGHVNTMLLEEDALKLPGIATTYQPTQTADGYVTIAAVTEQQMTSLLVAVGKEELLVDPRFATNEARLQNLEAFRAALGADLPEWETDAIIEWLAEHDVPCGPILRPDEVPEHPQIVANQTLIESDHPAMGRIREPRPPARFERTPSEIHRPAPKLGEHTDAVLERLGKSREEIDELRSAGAIG